MPAALLITAKDLRQRLRDRSAIMIGLMVPLGLAIVLNAAFGGLDDDVPVQPTFASVDGEGAIGAAFTDLLRRLEGDGLLTLEVSGSAWEAEDRVESGAVDAALVPSAGPGGVFAVEVIGNLSSPLATEMARSIAASFATQVAAGRLAVLTSIQLEPDLAAEAEELAQEVRARLSTTVPPVALEASQAADEQLDTTTYLAAGMAVFFVFFTVQFGVTSLLEERRDGTLQRLRAAPITGRQIVAAKALTSIVLGLTSLVTLVIATTLLLGASWGPAAGVALLVVAAVLAATGLMAVIAATARTTEQAGVWQSVTAVLLGALGGVFFDVSQGSRLMEQASLLTPHQWFLRGLGSIRAHGVGGAGEAVLAMLIFAVAGFAIAAFLARRGVRP